jgi:hypothetical protein
MAIAEVGSGSQRATIRGTNVASAAGVFPANVVSGNLLLVTGVFWNAASTATLSVSDTRSTSYTVLLSSTLTAGGGFAKLYIAYGIAPSSGACTATVTPSTSGNYINGVVDEFSGVDASPLDVDGSESTGTSTAPSDGLTTGTADALVVGVMTMANVSGLSEGSGYTLLDEDETYSRQPYGAEFKIAGAAGAQTVNWTLINNLAWRVYTASFKVAGAAAATSLIARSTTFDHMLVR